jgi:hypothetical protein
MSASGDSSAEAARKPSAVEVLRGGCLCGAVRFELTVPPRHASYCHCTRCQRRTGTAASANVAVDGRALRITAGEEIVRGWRHPDGGAEKCFCSECGAHLWARDPETGVPRGVRMSAFDTDPGVRPQWRQFTAYAAAWESIPDDGLPRHPEGRQPKP